MSREGGHASVFLDEYWQADSMRNTPLERIQDGSVGNLLIAQALWPWFEFLAPT